MRIRHFCDVIGISRKLLVVEQIRWHVPERRKAALHTDAYCSFLSSTVLDLQARKVKTAFTVFGGKFKNRLT